MTVLTLDPRGSTHTTDRGVLAQRPATLAGQTLGLVVNGVGDCEPMFDALAELLTERDGIAGTVKVVKASVAVPAYPQQWLEITDRATVAITGFGGCGSCSTRSMRDALDLEAAGIPAVCVVHDALVPAVQAISAFVGAPDYPVVTIGYPYDPTAHWTKEEAAEVAEQVLDAVRQRLTRA
jgi:hypothetical protein